VEVHSAIAGLHRSGAVSDAEKQGALTRLALLRRGWREILPDHALRELSTQLLDKYTLRAADSFQLAAALTWCKQKPMQRRFISGDQRLCEAAAAAGFAVTSLARHHP
jgi:predicted nucleic acid-binding protein